LHRQLNHKPGAGKEWSESTEITRLGITIGTKVG